MHTAHSAAAARQHPAAGKLTGGGRGGCRCKCSSGHVRRGVPRVSPQWQPCRPCHCAVVASTHATARDAGRQLPTHTTHQAWNERLLDTRRHHAGREHPRRRHNAGRKHPRREHPRRERARQRRRRGREPRLPGHEARWHAREGRDAGAWRDPRDGCDARGAGNAGHTTCWRRLRARRSSKQQHAGVSASSRGASDRHACFTGTRLRGRCCCLRNRGRCGAHAPQTG
jgi:hypothetical protein